MIQRFIGWDGLLKLWSFILFGILPTRPTEGDMDFSDAQDILNAITLKGYVESPKCETQKKQATKLEI